MRLHHLTVTAFGPFAGTVEVDFDELSAGGLFLLTGATGAGKTSVLDAVCFALYGQVPGDRSGAKHYRSDHAAPHLAPEVVLRLSVGERQLTFTRSPSWMRPKLRGAGQTKVQAHVLVEELREGTWTVLTNRLDDAGLLVTHLLGMSCTQFTQVAMLPQGRFQAFLRATSAERHAVLQQLFRTDRFERIEHWLVDRRSVARRASEAAAVGVRETVNRLQEVSGSAEDLGWTDDLAAAADDGSLESWATELVAEARDQHDAAAASSTAADAALQEAESALAVAVRSEQLRDRGLAARQELATWEARHDEVSTARDRIDLHQRAAGLTGLAASAGTARSRADSAERDWQLRRGTLSDLLGDDFGAEDLSAALRQAQDAVALAVAFGPRAAHREQNAERALELRRRLQSVEAGIAELELSLGAQPGEIADAAAAVREARAAAARLPLVLAETERLTSLQEAARRAELVGLELAAVRTDVLAATGTAQQARETYLDLREARINGMAGELAGQLASGCSCPVCGSATHPAPARPDAGGVGKAEEEAARRVLDDAEFELQARQVGQATLEGELAALEERLGTVDRGTIAGALGDARDEADRLEPLVAALDVLVAREEACRAQLEASHAQHRTALQERASLRTETDQVAAAAAALEAEWTALLGVPGAAPEEDPDVALTDLVRLRRRSVQVLSDATALLEAWHAHDQQADDLEAQTAAAARTAGFGSAGEALAAVLEPVDLQHLEDLLAEAEFGAHAAGLTLADPAVLAALDAEHAPVDDLEDRRTRAAATARDAATTRAAAEQRVQRLAVLTAELAGRNRAWDPLRERHRTVAALASFVEGKSTDNPQRMRLAAFVLAERLRQVVDAANERLAGMTDQRYALEHSDDRGYGEQRGGLSLRVRDDWNGVHRDPATLSGGETFVVSLALALGLADTVAHEAGGTDIDTLFIDEGFGSLDADTLEDVMDTLDALRDGGRVVGLVSHVPELRSRITTQLEVSKGRTGSTVRAAVSAG